MEKKDDFHREYGLLSGFLNRILNRFRIIAVLELSLLICSSILLVVLGSLFTIKFKETIPYLSLTYSIISILFILLVLVFGFKKIFFKASLEDVALKLEKKFPEFRDDITNSILLFKERKRLSGQISEGLIYAQIRKVLKGVSFIKPSDVVSFKILLRPIKLSLPLFLTFAFVLLFNPNLLNHSLALILNPLSDLPKKEVSIFIDPDKKTILRGTPLTINAILEGKRYDGERAILIIHPENDEDVSVPMEHEGDGRFKFHFTKVKNSFKFHVSYGKSLSPSGNITVADPPELKNIRLTLIHPEYTGLSSEIKEGGDIDALKGTLAQLEAKASKDVIEGTILFLKGNRSPLNIKGEKLLGSFIIASSDFYTIRLKDEMGFENPYPAKYQIRLIPDKYPEVEIIYPTENIEVMGNEVIPIIYRVKEDFGLKELRINYRIGSKEKLINLGERSNSRSIETEVYNWDLSTLNLISGDNIIFRIEALDNDSVSGPKLGYSKSITLLVKDVRERFSKSGDEAQRIADQILDLLADHLEEIKDRDELSKKMGEIIKSLDKSLENMSVRMDSFDLEGLRRNLNSLKERIHLETHERITQELERLSLFSEEIAKKSKMKEVETLSREVRNLQRRLVDSIKDLKERFTEEELRHVMKELEKIEDLLRSVIEALGKIAPSLPDEFINIAELGGIDFQDLFKDLEEIKKRLMAKDMSGALEISQRLLQILSEMMAALARAGTGAIQAPLERLQGEMSRQAGELERIISEQRDILSNTEGIEREIRKGQEDEVENILSKIRSKIEDILKGLGKGFSNEHFEDFINKSKRLLSKENIESFSDILKEFEKLSSSNENILREIREIIKELNLLKTESISTENRKRLSNLSQRENDLKERTEALRERLEILSQLFAGMDIDFLDDLRHASESMAEASRMLSKEAPHSAIPPEQEAIRRLSKSRQSIDRMVQQMAMQMQSMRGGYPLAYDPRPGWYYGPWAPMPTLPQPELMRPMQKGYTGIDREEFELPSKDAYKAPKIFREKAMESLKEGMPTEYRKEVEKYFKGLTE